MVMHPDMVQTSVEKKAEILLIVKLTGMIVPIEGFLNKNKSNLKIDHFRRSVHNFS